MGISNQRMDNIYLTNIAPLPPLLSRSPTPLTPLCALEKRQNDQEVRWYSRFQYYWLKYPVSPARLCPQQQIYLGRRNDK